MKQQRSGELTIQTAQHQGVVVDTKEGIDILACDTCGYKHIFPLPAPQTLEKLYQEKYYSQDKPKYIEEGEEDFPWWEATYREYYHLLSTHLYHPLVENSHFDSARQSQIEASRSERGTPSQIGKGDEEDRFGKAAASQKGNFQLEDGIMQSRGSVLEIGSGLGYFLRCGKRLGWNVLGIEPSQQASEYASRFGVEVIQSFFTEELATKIAPFDALFMDMVLEHVPDPVALLRHAKKALKKGGLLLISSPNDYNPFQEVLRDHLSFDPWWVVPKHHINYFDFASIQALLKKLDFEMIEMRGSFPMEFFLLGGENYIGNPQLGRKVHGIRKQFEIHLYETNPDLLRKLYRSFAQEGIGRSFLVLAKNL